MRVAAGHTNLQRWPHSQVLIVQSQAEHLLYIAMELRSQKAVMTGGNNSSSSSDTSGTSSSEEQGSENGLEGEEDAEVPKYERQRQENIKNNFLKLAELEIRILTGALKSSRVKSEAPGGGENRRSVKATPNPGASNHENSRSTVEYLSPKP